MAERRLRRRGAPRLHPGHTAGLQLGDDLVGDFVIKARPVLDRSARERYCLDIADLRDGRREPLSRPQPVTAKPRALLLSASK